MVLNAFDLTGKVAIVTGCDTGLGQGMTLGLAQAGCDIVGVNRRIPHETAEKVQALGRRFTAIQADLSRQDQIAAIVTQAVAAMGRVDILVNNAGTILRRSPDSSSRRAPAEKLLISPQCSHFRAVFGSRHTPPPKAACWALPA